MSATPPPLAGYASAERRYLQRVLLLALALALLTGAALIFAPRVDDVAVVANEPNGAGVPPQREVTVSFSREVDRRSAEDAFLLYPVTRGRLSWRDPRTLVFTPDPMLQPKTLYNVTIRAGLRDARGRVNRAETRWSFSTR